MLTAQNELLLENHSMCKEKNNINYNYKRSQGGNWLKGKYKKSSANKPLITIITVTKNSEKHLRDTLESIFNQTYKNFEIIIIDGKSTDKTLKIIKRHANKIDYWISEEDKGIYDAFNKGLSLSRGYFIGIVNSDDILKKNALKILVKYIKKNRNLDFLFGSVKKHWGVLHGYKKWKINFSWGFYSSHSTGFFIKNSSAKKVGKYKLKYRNHSDWDYFYRMIVKHNLTGLGTKKNEVFGIFRRGGHSSKIVYDEHIIETILIRLDNNQSKLLVLIISLYKYFNNLNLIRSKYKTFVKIFSRIIKH